MSNVIQNNASKGLYAVARNANGKVQHQTPEALHPGNMNGDGPEASYARQVLTSESQYLAELNGLYMRGDNRLKDRLRQRQSGGLDNAKRDMLALAKRHDDALKEAANFKADPAMATAIVGIFSNMQPHEHAPAVAKLIEEGDGPTLAALASVSSVLTKLGPEVKGTIRNRLYAKTDPVTFAAMQEAEANARRIDHAMNVMVADLTKFAAAAAPDVPADIEAHSVASGFNAA